MKSFDGFAWLLLAGLVMYLGYMAGAAAQPGSPIYIIRQYSKRSMWHSWIAMFGVFCGGTFFCLFIWFGLGIYSKDSFFTALPMLVIPFLYASFYFTKPEPKFAWEDPRPPLSVIIQQSFSKSIAAQLWRYYRCIGVGLMIGGLLGLLTDFQRGLWLRFHQNVPPHSVTVMHFVDELYSFFCGAGFTTIFAFLIAMHWHNSDLTRDTREQHPQLKLIYFGCWTLFIIATTISGMTHAR